MKGEVQLPTMNEHSELANQPSAKTRPITSPLSLHFSFFSFPQLKIIADGSVGENGLRHTGAECMRSVTPSTGFRL